MSVSGDAPDPATSSSAALMDEPLSLVVTRRNGDEHTILYDAADQGLVVAHHWHVQVNRSGVVYAATNRRSPTSRSWWSTVLMHQLLTGERDVDHVNLNGLDNRRINLRSATRSQQLANTRSWRGSSSYKGVSRTPWGWAAKVRVDGKQRWLGTFATEVEAAAAYDTAARQAWGDFARLNFPNGATA